MEPIREWTIAGEVPLTIRVYAPRTTLMYGDAPEVAIEPGQVVSMGEYFSDMEAYFETRDPDMLRLSTEEARELSGGSQG